VTSTGRLASGAKARRRVADPAFRWTTVTLAAVVVVLLIALVVELALSSWPVWDQFGPGFVTDSVWDNGAALYGALPFIAGTVVTSLLAMVFAVPVGLCASIFLAELAPRWLAVPLTFLIELIAAVPSVVIGLWGMFVITPIVRDTIETFAVDNLAGVPFLGGPAYGSDVFAAGVILAIMVVPTIVAISREVITNVPRESRDALLALGATRWETVRRVVLPAAKSGILGAIILGLGRALGETMAVTMMIGNADRVPTGLFDQGQTIASKIATSFNEASAGLETQSLLALGLVLLAITLAVGIVSRLLVGRSRTPLRVG
jgi:phosphate transport system permease protein